MPHLLIEYSGNLISSFEQSNTLQGVHKIMLDSGLFAPETVKSRAHVAANFLIGTNSEEEHTSFIHARVFLLEGRNAEQKSALSTALFENLKMVLPHASHVSVDIRDMDETSYRKS